MRELKKWIPLLAVPLAVVLLAPTTPRDEKETLKAAAHHLAELGNYTWRATLNRSDESVELAERALFGPAEGFQEKEGFVRIQTKDETPLDVVLRGGKMAVRLEDGWVSEHEMETQGKRHSRALAFVRSLKAVPRPAAEAQDLLKHAKEVKSPSEGYFVSTLAPDAAKELLHRSVKTTGRAPKISEAAGQLSFWVRGGTLVKYEVQLRGELTFDSS